MTEEIDLVLSASRVLSRVAVRVVEERSLSAYADAELCALVQEIEAAGRLIDTLRVSSAAAVEQRSRHELGENGLARRSGCTKGAHLIERLTRVSQAEAVRRIRLGQAVNPPSRPGEEQSARGFSLVAHAMASGSLGVDAATIIVRCLQQVESAGHEQLLEAENSLVETATEQAADIVGIHARAWRESLDPAGAEPRDHELRRRRSFTLGREVNGMTPLRGWADPASAALLRGMLSEGSNPKSEPRFLSEDESRALNQRNLPGGQERNGGVDATAMKGGRSLDPRTREQRHFDILLGTVTAGLRETERPGNMRPLTTVSAVIRASDLENGRGAGWLDGVSEPVSASTIRQMACDAGVRAVFLGENGEVLHLGRTRRLFSAAQRKALAIRDGGCVWPGCSAPPSWCEAHHVIEYHHGGTTDIDNGTLLCSAHHHALHASDYRMQMNRGRPELLAPPWLDPDQVWKPLGRTRAVLAA